MILLSNLRLPALLTASVAASSSAAVPKRKKKDLPRKACQLVLVASAISFVQLDEIQTMRTLPSLIVSVDSFPRPSQQPSDPASMICVACLVIMSSGGCLTVRPITLVSSTSSQVLPGLSVNLHPCECLTKPSSVYCLLKKKTASPVISTSLSRSHRQSDCEKQC